MILHFDRLRVFRQVIAKTTNDERYMRHKEPDRIDHTTLPDGRVIKYVPIPTIKGKVSHTIYPDGRVIKH